MISNKTKLHYIDVRFKPELKLGSIFPTVLISETRQDTKVDLAAVRILQTIQHWHLNLKRIKGKLEDHQNLSNRLCSLLAMAISQLYYGW